MLWASNRRLPRALGRSSLVLAVALHRSTCNLDTAWLWTLRDGRSWPGEGTKFRKRRKKYRPPQKTYMQYEESVSSRAIWGCKSTSEDVERLPSFKMWEAQKWRTGTTHTVGRVEEVGGQPLTDHHSEWNQLRLWTSTGNKCLRGNSLPLPPYWIPLS